MKNAKKLLKEFNIPKKTPLIVAVSGGVDSMVLLDFLLKEKYQLIIVHFNHNTRDTNERDEKLVVDYAEKHHLTHYVFNINVASGNFQNEARKKRYKLLEKTARKHLTPYIVTAHHLDDLAETVLIKMTRGSNLYGYAGIHPLYKENDFIFIKPLLFTDKQEIIKYSVENNIPYYHDESNFTDNYLRNRYRHAIIPILKQENPQFLNKMLNFHKQLADTSAFLKAEAKKHLFENNKILIDDFTNLDLVIQKEVISLLLESYELNFTFETIEKIRKMLLNNTASASYTLEKNHVLIKSYNQAFIINKKTILDFDITLVEGENALPNMKKITFSNNASIIEEDSVKICYNKLSLPLHARTRKPGDTLAFKYGHKKLKDFLIDLKVPKHSRDEIWMITDNNGTILWIKDFYKNETLGSKNELNLLIGEKSKNEQNN